MATVENINLKSHLLETFNIQKVHCTTNTQSACKFLKLH